MRIVSFKGAAPELPETGSFYIADDVTVIGRVRLGVDVSIWYGSVLRGDNDEIEIGDRSNIQDLCVLHTDPGFPIKIGQDCGVGHRAIAHGCTIGDNSLVGMGAILLNGAVIGRNCLIGAGTLIPQGREVPDNSMVVGSPGRVVREVTDKDIAGIQRGVQSYIARYRIYAAEATSGTR